MVSQAIAPRSDLPSQAHPSRTGPAEQTTGRPFVQLVDLDGRPVHDSEHFTETCPPDPTDPADWPAWTDNWFYGTAEDLADEDRPDPAPSGVIPFGRTFDGAGWPELPPISGGSPEAEGFEPDAEDLADYHRWSEELDRRRDAEDFYRRHPLSEFNAIRVDA